MCDVFIPDMNWNDSNSNASIKMSSSHCCLKWLLQSNLTILPNNRLQRQRGWSDILGNNHIPLLYVKDQNKHNKNNNNISGLQGRGKTMLTFLLARLTEFVQVNFPSLLCARGLHVKGTTWNNKPRALRSADAKFCPTPSTWKSSSLKLFIWTNISANGAGWVHGNILNACKRYHLYYLSNH